MAQRAAIMFVGTLADLRITLPAMPTASGPVSAHGMLSGELDAPGKGLLFEDFFQSCS